MASTTRRTRFCNIFIVASNETSEAEFYSYTSILERFLARGAIYHGGQRVPMKVLVRGSSGHLGEALVRTLLDSGTQAVGLNLLESPFTTHVGSISDARHEASHLLEVATLRDEDDSAFTALAAPGCFDFGQGYRVDVNGKADLGGGCEHDS